MCGILQMKNPSSKTGKLRRWNVHGMQRLLGRGNKTTVGSSPHTLWLHSRLPRRTGQLCAWC